MKLTLEIEYWTATVAPKSADELEAERYLFVVPTDALDVYFYSAKTDSSATVLYQAYVWMGVFAAVCGPFMERRGPRIGMAVSAIMLAVGYGGFCGGGFGILFVSTMTATQKWFPDIRGLTAGMCTCSFGVGSFTGSYAFEAMLYQGGALNKVDMAQNIPHVFWTTGSSIKPVNCDPPRL
ncbi:hypothetical protein H310_10384 [Aphanomyces invadans]|uniref:Major facilitator superfamily (MFS) profile domain-containing protein n=1 Tax=Aphanomyces invadans TaxID=157072 RepID=A0A024TPW9_9STRA|nr:hypothetical protein H310_10384 [Aphanomyces invadans]ETV96190.1 hypothetical protein H310_10384 [Aphanomyces invadans]|eukprot:XP_008874982.1 hypothetical protein H310_10384 [Aphanomyces invadans]